MVIAKKYSIFDIPNGRKTHHGSIPRLGGVSFTPSVIFAMTFTIGVFFKYINKSDVAAYSGYYPDMMECNLFLCGLLLIYFGGVKDDLVGLRYRHKFLIQILSAMLVVFSGIYIDNFYGLLGIHEVVPWIGIPLTVIILIFVINAINLIDGIDGLASSISIFACCIYGTLFLFHGLWVYAALAFSTVGALIPFFCYNVFGNIKKGRKLFMGDAGSLTLGFILSYLSVRYICHIPEFMMAPIGNALVVAVSPILIPMLDVVRVVLVRLRKRRHIFKADRNHIHHKLLDMGMSKSSALLLILSLNATFCIINFILMQHLNCTFIFLTDILLWSAANIYFSYVKKKRNVSIAVY
ncbi:MAG: undecaprenyl/decaprenyl-phosphate alpha-N-acetylglucosaminyl 1-phosphate transferase [Tannerella sp.]|nr:undecaprenyl/decaprenyl-phosphate alpha-N-acetylglucosaminyl 1-phosphate transferase [Tannerella sp.]